MKKGNIFSKGEKRSINPAFFTNKVGMIEISNLVGSKEQKIYHVTFSNGAKTKVHLHSGVQLLIITRGLGTLEIFKKIGNEKKKFKIKSTDKVNLKVGDIIRIPPKILHTHGAKNKIGAFSHIAINLYPSKNQEPKTVWYESDFKANVYNILV